MATTLVASRNNLMDTPASTGAARLVLAVGSRAGREAPLQYGYYLIGRHRECQIRPKSRSVSRRHCLLYQDDTGLKVFDLGSTAGTRVNDLRLRPQTWTTLRHGDMLRCGKVAFRVDFGETESGNSVASKDPAAPMDAARDTGKSMPVGEAWHDVDIAGFLETADDADRERRYSSIRSANEHDAEDSEDSSDDHQTTIEMDSDLDLFDDAFNDPEPAVSGADGSKYGTHDLARTVSHADAKSVAPAAQDSPPESRKETKASRRSKAIPERPARSATTRRFSMELFANGERWKMIGITFLMLTILAVVGYSAYHFYTGPQVRVLHSID